MQGQGLGGALKGAAGGALGGLGGGLLDKLTGGSSGGFMSNIAGQLGGMLKNNFAPGGQIDFGKLLGAGGGIANMIGQGQQRKSAQDYANAQIGQRNALMSKILAPQNYGVNLNQQSGATPASGSGTTGGY